MAACRTCPLVTSCCRAHACACTEADADHIGVDGVIKLCEDLGVDAEDIIMLVIAWELKVPSLPPAQRARAPLD